MKQSEKMKEALLKNVISPLLEEGFVGKYPHYRKVCGDRIELLTVEKNKRGGSFTIEVSTVFPHAEPKKGNYYSFEGDPAPGDDDFTVWNTKKRYRLKGTFDGWFYYCDVYKTRERITPWKTIDFYAHALDGKKEAKLIEEGYKCVLHADNDIYDNICTLVNGQMKKARRWWKKMRLYGFLYCNERHKI